MIALTFLSNTSLFKEVKTVVVKETTRFSGNKNQLRFKWRRNDYDGPVKLQNNRKTIVLTDTTCDERFDYHGSVQHS